MNYADLHEAQEEKRAAFGKAFAQSATTSPEVTLRRRKEAEAAVRAEQTKAFEAAVLARLDETETENGPEGQE